MGTALDGWLDEVQARGIKLGLDRIRHAMVLASRPQDAFPSLLVGGTNGKGSTVAFATSLLMAAGHRVGSTISPHLLEYRERFRIDGRPIGQADLEALAARLEPLVRGRPGMEDLTYFELGILLALGLFADRGVGAAVVEVGMGGELDATRACDPAVAALVTVDLDHEQFLGETVAQIARTKARIAPGGGVLVTTETRQDRLPVIEEEAARAGSRLLVAGRDFEYGGGGGLLHYASPSVKLDGVRLALAGDHQAQNAACALASVEALCALRGLTAPDPWQCASGLQGARMAGRLERTRVPGGPAFLLDGAHNPAGAQVLARALSQRRRPLQRVWLLASMHDKKRGPMLDLLLPHVDRVICTRGGSSPRFEDPAELAGQVRAAGGKAETRPACREAAMELASALGPRDEVLVAGSLYLVGEVRAALGMEIG